MPGMKAERHLHRGRCEGGVVKDSEGKYSCPQPGHTMTRAWQRRRTVTTLAGKRRQCANDGDRPNNGNNFSVSRKEFHAAIRSSVSSSTIIAHGSSVPSGPG